MRRVPAKTQLKIVIIHLYFIPIYLKESYMLGIGEKFPVYSVTATVSRDKNKAFETITNESYPGKWKVYFFWPKDFTFVCPTEIAAFGKLNSEFQDRDAQILGGSVDSEFVHLAWRNNHEELQDMPFPMLADVKRDLCEHLGVHGEAQVLQVFMVVSPRKMHELRIDTA